MPLRRFNLPCLALLAGAACGLLSPVFAVAAPTTQPVKVTLHLDHVTPRRAVEQFAAQVGVPLPLIPTDVLDKDTDPRVSVNLTGVPFWQAAFEVGRQCNLEPVAGPEDPYPRFQFGLGRGTFWRPPHAVAGPLLISVTDVARSSTVDLGRTRHQFQRDLTLTLTACAEPELRVLAVYPEIRLVAATDALGQSLLPDDAADRLKEAPSAPPGTGGGNVYLTHFSVELSCPEKRADKIAHLKGRATVRVQTASQRLEFEDVMKVRKVAKTAVGVPVTFNSLKKADIEYVLQFSLRRDRKVKDSVWADLHDSVYNGQMALYDAKGRLVASRATENGGDYSNTKIDASLRFVREPGVSDPDAGEPYKLVWEAPAQSQNLTFDFELTDIPMPG